MKDYRRLLIVVLFTCAPIYAQYGWFWQNPLPQGNDLLDIFVFDQNTVIAVGSVGTVIKTTDAGESWSIYNGTSGTSDLLTSVHFFNSSEGWAAGDNGTIIKTTDGGMNWNTQISGTELDLKDVFFVDSDTGFVVGGLLDQTNTPGHGIVLKTTDGGDTWKNKLDISYRLNAIHFIDENTGWAVGVANTGWADSIAFKTTDGGANWICEKRLINGENRFNFSGFDDIYFLNEDIGWIVGQGKSLSEYIILKTIDGGRNWVRHKLTQDNAIFSTVCFADSNHGWGIGQFGIYKSDDGGENWYVQHEEGRLRAGDFFDENIGWVVGRWGEILRTEDGGENWTYQSHGMRRIGTLFSVYFIDEYTGWAVGYIGKILKTIDGGNQWMPQISGTNYNLNSVYFSDENCGWIAGSIPYLQYDGGVVKRTTNGGDNWSTCLTGTSDFNSLYFADENTGWVVGTLGSILKTTDGGDNWVSQTTGDTKFMDNWTIINIGPLFNLYSVYFYDLDQGWAVGARGQLFKTINGGEDWNYHTVGVTDASLRGVYFVDEQIGWIVCGGGIILKTVDGGEVWIEQTSGTTNNLQSVHFLDQNTGWVSGEEGVILKTVDGGNIWSHQNDPPLQLTSTYLNSIYFIDHNTGWVVGWEGCILKTTDGGTWVEDIEYTGSIISDGIDLLYNYPNPFNQSTKIRFSLMETSFITLKIYNLLGNEIEILVSERKQVGDYEIEWNAEDLPSGIYLCRLVAGDYVETKKLVLQR